MINTRRLDPPRSIWACIIFYNDGTKMLKRAIKSCKRAGLKILAVDGKFSAFDKGNGSHWASTDGCRELAKREADLFVESPEGGWCDKWGGQPAKRSVPFEVLEPDDFFINIDADETVARGRVSLDSLRYEFMTCNVYSMHKKESPCILNVRGFRVNKHYRYRFRHNCIYDDRHYARGNMNPRTGLVLYKYSMLKPMEIKNGTILQLNHYDDQRPEERKGLDDKFYEDRTENMDIMNVIRG